MMVYLKDTHVKRDTTKDLLLSACCVLHLYLVVFFNVNLPHDHQDIKDTVKLITHPPHKVPIDLGMEEILIPF